MRLHAKGHRSTLSIFFNCFLPSQFSSDQNQGNKKWDSFSLNLADISWARLPCQWVPAIPLSLSFPSPLSPPCWGHRNVLSTMLLCGCWGPQALTASTLPYGPSPQHFFFFKSVWIIGNLVCLPNHLWNVVLKNCHKEKGICAICHGYSIAQRCNKKWRKSSLGHNQNLYTCTVSRFLLKYFFQRRYVA